MSSEQQQQQQEPGLVKGQKADKNRREAGVVYLHIFKRWAHGPNPSPFCLRLEAYLRMARLPYVAVQDARPTGPKKKMPWIELDGKVYADSELIIEMLERRFQPGLEPDGAAHAVSVMAAERLYWVSIHNQFIRHTDVVFRDMIIVPRPVQWILRGTMIKELRSAGEAHGVYKHSEAEMDEMARRDLRAAAAVLGARDFLGGGRPCAADAMLFATLSNFLSGDFPHAARGWVAEGGELPSLRAYFDRFKARVFPDWDTVAGDAADKVYR